VKRASDMAELEVRLKDLKFKDIERDKEMKSWEEAFKKKQDYLRDAEGGILKEMVRAGEMVAENQRLNCEFVAALSFTVMINSELLWNTDQKWRIKTLFTEAAQTAANCSEKRIEVIGMRPGLKKSTQIDIHILPQLFAPPNELPAQTIAEELIRQVRDPESKLRTTNDIGKSIVDAQVRYEHEYVHLFSQTLRAIDKSGGAVDPTWLRYVAPE